MPTMRVADYITDFLVKRGADTWFILTGNGAMYLNDAIAQQNNLKYFAVRHEIAAPLMAESFARLTGRVGVVSVTSGPGAANAIPGVAEAYVDSAPILVLSGQAPSNELPPENATRPVRTFGTAGLEILPVVRPITKYAARVASAQSVRYHLERAWYEATEGRPGPVWLDVPMDIQYAEIDPDTLEPYVPPSSTRGAAVAAARAILDLLAGAKRPVIFAGQGIRQAGAVEQFRRLVDVLGAPVMFSRLGQDLMAHDHPLCLGQGGLHGVIHSPAIQARADVVVALGCRLAVQLAGHNLSHFADDAKVAMVDIDPAELQAHGDRLTLAINADLADVLDALLVEAKAVLPVQPWVRECQELMAANPMVRPEMTGDPINLYHFMSRLDAVAGPRNVMITDSGSNYFVGGQVFRFGGGQREITSASFVAMGLSIPLAIGAAVANSDNMVLAVTGDGSLELNIQELKTMSYYDLNIKLFVINNGGYVSMRNWQDNYFEGRRIGSDDETGTEMLNLKRVAAAFDLRYDCIGESACIDTDLQRILATEGPLFVEVICDSRQKLIKPYEK